MNKKNVVNRQTNQYQTHLSHVPQQTLHHNPYATARHRRVAGINISFQSHGHALSFVKC